MRITNNMISNNYLSSFNKAQERMAKLQEQLTDGKLIHRPSDDPVRAVHSLSYNTNLAANEQFTQNVKDATSWMDTTDSAMSEISSIMTRAKELVISADGTKPVESLQAIGKEIDGLINSAIAVGNSQLGERYLFAGQNDKTLPLERQTINGVEVVVYHGDENKISMPLKTGVATPSQDSVNLTGIDAFGPAVTLATTPPTTTLKTFNDLLRIKNELMKTSAQPTQSNSAGGAATVGGTFSGSGYQDFVVKIDTFAAGDAATATYSLDGGVSWLAAGVGAGSPPTITLGATGMTMQVATSASNVNNDTYSFSVPLKSTPDVNWLSSVGMVNVKAGHDYVLQAQTEVGVRSSTYAMMENMLNNDNTTITEALSKNEDLDIAKAIVDFKSSENVYNAALSMGSKIMPQSLVDFLK